MTPRQVLALTPSDTCLLISHIAPRCPGNWLSGATYSQAPETCPRCLPPNSCFLKDHKGKGIQVSALQTPFFLVAQGHTTETQPQAVSDYFILVYIRLFPIRIHLCNCFFFFAHKCEIVQIRDRQC